MKKLFSLLLVAFASNLVAGEYPDISIKELQKAIDASKVAVIDVNGAKSFARGHIPTAIDFSSNAKSLAKVLPKDKGTLVVSYCGGPGSELISAELMQQRNLVIKTLSIFRLGYPDGRNLVLN